MRKIRLIRAFGRCCLLISVGDWQHGLSAPETPEGFRAMREQLKECFHDRSVPIWTYELAVSFSLIQSIEEKPLAEVIDV